MKISKLFAALGLCAAIAPAAYAAEIDVIYNGSTLALEGEIINDRIMVNTDSLETLGISVYAEGGFWDLKKDDISVWYDEIYGTLSRGKGEYDESTGTFSDGKTEFTSDVMPVTISNTQLFPLRAFAEQFGIAVGWDEYEGTVVLIDFDAYFAELEQTSPELYKLLMLTMKQPAVGIGSGEFKFNLNIPANEEQGMKEFKLALKMVMDNAVLNGVSSESAVLEELSFVTSELNYALSDVTIDGIYDAATQTMYLKTNAVEKIRDSLPEEYKTQFDGIAQIFSSNVWYKITLKDYITFLCESFGASMGSAYTGQMAKTMESMYTDGVRFGDVFRMSFENEYFLNDVYAFEEIQAMFYSISMLTESGMMKVENADGGNSSLTININVDALVEYMVGAAKEYGYTPTAEEIAQMKQEMTEMFGTGDILSAKIELADGVPVLCEMKMDFNMDGVSLNLDLNSTFDVNATPDEIALPGSAVDLLPLIQSLINIAEQV